MTLLPIKQTLEENETFAKNPLCNESLSMCIDFYKELDLIHHGSAIMYEENDELVGSAAFKGRPINNTVEISYGTMENHRQQGVGTRICKQLVELSLATDPSVRITCKNASWKKVTQQEYWRKIILYCLVLSPILKMVKCGNGNTKENLG